MKISIIGLGKLGSPMMVVMAHKGHSVLGVDLNPGVVEAVNQGKAPVKEPGLQEMIDANRERISATGSYAEGILATDMTLIIVPTPSGPDGRFSMRYVLSAAEQIGAALRKKKQWHLVVLSSTVMPGSPGGVLLPALEKSSGMRSGPAFARSSVPLFIPLRSRVPPLL